MRIAHIDIFVNVEPKLNQEIEKVLHRYGESLVRDAKQRAPVDTGRLRRSIEYLITTVHNGLKLVFGSGVAGGDKVPYSGYQEYGTRYIEPKRYLRGAYEDQESALMADIERAVVEALQ